MEVSAKARRRVILVLAGSFALYLLYVGASFAALRMGVLNKLTRDVDDFKLDASGGYSLWPGHAVLRDVRLRFKDHNIEVGIEARELSLHASLLPLFSKTVRIDEIVLHAARYKMLHRVHDGHRNRERLAAFPDIGFERSKIYDSPRPPYGVPPYRIRVERIRASVLEVWILEYRALGNFEATGGFDLHEHVSVLPSHADLSGARLYLGDREISKDADCDVRARLDPFPGRAEVTEVLQKTSGTIQCRMPLEDLSAFGAYWPDSHFVLEGGANVSTKLELVSGQLRASTAHVTAHLRRVGLEGAGLEGAALGGTLNFDARIDSAGRMHVSGALDGEERTGSHLEVDDVTFGFDLAQPHVWQLSLEKAKVRAGELSVLDPALVRRVGLAKAPPMKLERADLELSYVAPNAPPETVWPGTLSLVSKGAVAAFPAAETTVACAYRADLRCEVESDRLRCPDSEFRCAPLTASRGSNDQATIGLHVQAERLDLHRGEMQSAWVVGLDDPTKVLKWTVAHDFWTKLGLELAPLGDVTGRLRINHRNQTLAGTVDELRSGPFVANAGFLLANHFVSRWRIDTPLGRFGVAQDPGGTKVTPFVDDWDVLAFDR